jgi:hypothetical protein
LGVPYLNGLIQDLIGSPADAVARAIEGSMTGELEKKYARTR